MRIRSQSGETGIRTSTGKCKTDYEFCAQTYINITQL